VKVRAKGYLPGLLLFLVVLGAQAQHARYSTRNYTAVDGLPQSQVMALREDQYGYLWIATQGGGLARFDGREFKVYTTRDGLLSNDILALHIDRRQHIWIVHPNGMSKLEGTTVKRFYNPDGRQRNKHHMRYVLERGDTVFAVNATGTLTKIYRDTVVYWDKAIVSGKTIWRHIKTPDGTSCFFLDDNSFLIQTANKSFAFSSEEPTGKIYNVFLYRGQVLFKSERGLFKLNYGDRSVEKLTWNLGDYVLLYDEKEDIFWTSNGMNFVRQKLTQGRINADTILQDITIQEVIVDSEGNTWLASNGNGLYRYSMQDFQRTNGEFGGVMAILNARDGSQWFGSMYKGLCHVRGGNIKYFADPKEHYRNDIRTIKQAPDGTVWVGTGYGLGRYREADDDFTWYGRKEGLAGYSVMAIDFDAQGGMWIATTNGLSYYDGHKFRNYTTAEGLSSNSVRYVYYSRYHKTVFVSNDENGLQRLRDNDRFEVVPVPGFRNTAAFGIQPYRDSLLVIASGGAGVVIADPVHSQSHFLTMEEGLASDFIYFVTEDEHRNIWIGSEKGINRVKLNAQFEMVQNLYYGYDNGLLGVETNSNAFDLTPHGKYFGLVDGLYQYNDMSDKPWRSFDLHLTSLQVFYGEYSPLQYAPSSEGFFNLPVNPQFPPDRNHLTFTFNRVDKRYPKSVKFQYYLENFDKKWSRPSSIGQVTYSNLPPGNYVLHVMSTDKRGSWGQVRVNYPFAVKAPFYKTAAFIVGAFILLAGVVTLVLYLRVKQRVNKMILLERIRIREQENLRKEIARDFHDEMGNQLTRIINYISLLKLNSNGNGHGNNNDLYTKVENSAKYLYTGTRDFIWSIDPVNDELSKLFLHIRDFGEKLFEEKSIQFRAFNDVREKIKLPYGFSRDANLIFKEVMTNAFKYSEANNVKLSLTRAGDDGFELSVEDDGVGFKAAETQKTNGLQNIRDRADKLGSVLRIHSVPEQGTRISLTFKITKKPHYGITL
jgi:signal transduction histidine kinase/ligand-binding sensor domain-containing protein